MKRVEGLAVLLCLASAAAVAVETASIPLLSAPGLIDGELTEPSWKKAYESADFVPTDPAKSVTENARAYLFCDNENLYVGARMEFADYSAHEKWVSADAKPYGGESVEIFIDPGDTGAYAQFIVTEAGGLVFSSELCEAVEVAAQMHEKDWTLEAKIPYSAIRLSADSFGKCWRVNVVRNNRQKKESSSWSRLSGGGFHEPAAFNRVEGIPADLAAIRREQAFAAKGDFDIGTDHLVYTTQDVVRATLDFLYDKPMKAFRAVAALKDERGKAVVEKTVSPVAFHVDFALSASRLVDGRYDLAVALLDADGKVVKSGEARIGKIPPMPVNPDKWEIRNNCTYRNGEFFFPITTSLVNWNFSCTNREDALRQMDALFGELAECGFNCAQPVPGNFPDEDTETYAKCKMPYDWEKRTFATTKAAGITFDDYCRVAAKHGVWLVANSPYLNRTISPLSKDCLVDHLRRLREKPNIFCWYMSDEKDGRPEFNRMLNRFYHDIDPTRPTRINLINAVMQHIDAADIISTDPYPVPVSRLSKVSSHGDRLVRATENRPGQARWLVLQMFGNEGVWTRPPTPEEIKCMTMLAVNHGATGLGFFTWTPHRLRTGKRQHPGSMQAVKEVSAVLRKCAPALCQGKVVFRGRIGGADVLAVEHEGRRVLSVVNDTDADIAELVVEIKGFGKTTVCLGKHGYDIVEL